MICHFLGWPSSYNKLFMSCPVFSIYIYIYIRCSLVGGLRQGQLIGVVQSLHWGRIEVVSRGCGTRWPVIPFFPRIQYDVQQGVNCSLIHRPAIQRDRATYCIPTVPPLTRDADRWQFVQQQQQQQYTVVAFSVQIGCSLGTTLALPQTSSLRSTATTPVSPFLPSPKLVPQSNQLFVHITYRVHCCCCNNKTTLRSPAQSKAICGTGDTRSTCGSLLCSLGLTQQLLQCLFLLQQALKVEAGHDISWRRTASGSHSQGGSWLLKKQIVFFSSILFFFFRNRGDEMEGTKRRSNAQQEINARVVSA